jgi:predicted nucleotidyltransferase
MTTPAPETSALPSSGEDAVRQPGAPSPALLDEVVRRIVEVAQPERIILFGSAARGEMGPDSDLDLLLIKADVPHKRTLAAQVTHALRGLRHAFDIIVATPDEIDRYGESPALIFRDALREGKTLYVS